MSAAAMTPSEGQHSFFSLGGARLLITVLKMWSSKVPFWMHVGCSLSMIGVLSYTYMFDPTLPTDPRGNDNTGPLDSVPKRRGFFGILEDDRVREKPSS